MTVEFVLITLASYLLGSVPSAYLAVKWSRGMDIREYGSGNVGASNVKELTSIWFAIPTVIFDLGKGMVMVWVAEMVGLGVAQKVTIGIAAVIGHNWPVFLRFNGGRGIATALGVIAILAPWLALIVIAIAACLFPFFRAAMGTLVALVLLPMLGWFLRQPLGIDEPLPITLGFLAILLITVLRRVTVPRRSVSASVSGRQLFINRLLSDRDIRDREAWVNRKPSEASIEKQRENKAN